MTTGEPLIVRGAMKPLPTLTKPLRSVDTRDEGAGRCAARAHRLVHGAGRGRGRRGDGGARAGLGLPREVRRRPHRRRPRRARRLPGADRVEALGAAAQAGAGSSERAARRALVLVGFMGAGKSSTARMLAAELGRPGARLRPRDRARAGRADRRLLRPRGRARVPRARGGGGAAAPVRPARAGDRAGRRLARIGARARGVAHARGRAPRGGARGGLAARVQQGPAAGARPGALRAAARRPRGALRLGGARDPAAGRPQHAAPRARRARGAARCSAGHAADVGLGRARATTRCSSAAGLVASGFFHPHGGRRFVVTDENVARAPYGQRGGDDQDPAGRDREDARARRGGAARAGARRRHARPTWPWPWAAAWWATSRASARPSTSAGCATCRCPRRSWRRWTRPTAARPAWTCRRARTTRARSTSRRR